MATRAVAERRSAIWLIRHGETEWSASGRHTGRSDIALTATGRSQAEALSRHLEGRRFERVLVSPLARARDTCRLAGYEAVAEVEPAIAEWDYGDYEGRTTAEIRVERPGWSVWSHDLPGGERLEAVAGRADRVVGGLSDVEGEVAVFSHAHLLRVLTARWLGLEPVEGRRFVLGTAAIAVLGWERENRVVVCWNQSWHLGVEVKP
jgi:probable phosphoglycerate mutase